jgi:hypothetical protein
MFEAGWKFRRDGAIPFTTQFLKNGNGRLSRFSPIDILPAGVDVGEIPVTTDSALEEAEVPEVTRGGGDLRGADGKFHICSDVCLVP